MKGLLSSLLILNALLLLVPRGTTAAAPVQEAEGDRLQALRLQRLRTLRAIEESVLEYYHAGQADYPAVAAASLERCEAELELADSPEARLATLREMVGLAARHEELNRRRAEAGVATEVAVLRAAALRLQYEIVLEEERGR